MPTRVDPQHLVIHDTSPIVDGPTARESLRRSIELAEWGDRPGHRRYWAAEIHGMTGAAGCDGMWVGVIAADSADEAEFLAGSHRLKAASGKLWGRTMRLPSPEVAAEQRPPEPDDLKVFQQATDGFVIGDGATVRRRLAELRERTRADELIVRTPIHDPWSVGSDAVRRQAAICFRAW